MSVLTNFLILSPEDVRRIRRSHHFTQKQFALKLGVACTTVARWETGSRECKGDYAFMVKQLDIPF